jgi:hypothetical protein
MEGGGIGRRGRRAERKGRERDGKVKREYRVRKRK